MAQQRRGGFKRRKKVDFIAANKIEVVDYKDTELLKRFISERGKILPRRVTGSLFLYKNLTNRVDIY